MSIIIAIGIVTMIFSLILALFRLYIGPHLLDRVLAVDFMLIIIISFLGLIAAAYEYEVVLDIALALALLSSIVALAFTRYLTKEDKT
ncbi:MAG: monovalent cation/H+ antiporter complex subunit F [Oligoflexus sp.]